MIKSILLATAGLGLLTSAAMANPYGKDRHHHRHHKMEHMLEKLDLNDAQKLEVEQLRASLKEQMKPNYEQLEALHKEKKEVLKADVLDEGRLRDLMVREAQVKADGVIAKQNTHRQIMALLTPEQTEKYEQMKEKMKNKKKKKNKKYRGDKS